MFTNTTKKTRRYILGAAVVAFVGVFACVGIHSISMTYEVEERTLQVREELANMQDEMFKAYEATINARQKVSQAIETAGRDYENQLTQLQKDGNIDPKSILSNGVKMQGNILAATAVTANDLKPSRVVKAVTFVKSHSIWLKEMGIELVDELEELQRINHEYKFLVMQFSKVTAVVLQSTTYAQQKVGYLKRFGANPKYAKMIMKQAFTGQKDCVEACLVELEKIEKGMKRSSRSMQIQSAKMQTAGSEVLGGLDKMISAQKLKEKLLKKKIEYVLKDIVTTTKQKFEYFKEVIPKVIPNNYKLECNPNKIIYRKYMSNECHDVVTYGRWKRMDPWWISRSRKIDKKCDLVEKEKELTQDCDSKIAAYTNARNMENLRLQREYARRDAQAQNDMNKMKDKDQRKKAETIRALRKQSLNYELELSKAELKINENMEKKNRWVSTLKTLNLYAYYAQQSADMLLTEAIQYRGQLNISYKALDNLENSGLLDPNWLSGKSKEPIPFGKEPKEVATCVNAMAITFFAEQMVDAYKVIAKNAKERLEKIEDGLLHWGEPVPRD